MYQRVGTDEIEPPAMPTSAVVPSDLDSQKASSTVQGTPVRREGDFDNHLLGRSERHGTQKRHNWRPRFEGWRAGASIAAVLALLSLLINFGGVVWLGSKGAKSALVSVYEGPCSVVAHMDIWVHLVINIVSTLLLGGSNYCSTLSLSSLDCCLIDSV